MKVRINEIINGKSILMKNRQRRHRTYNNDVINTHTQWQVQPNWWTNLVRMVSCARIKCSWTDHYDVCQLVLPIVGLVQENNVSPIVVRPIVTANSIMLLQWLSMCILASEQRKIWIEIRIKWTRIMILEWRMLVGCGKGLTRMERVKWHFS